MVLPLQPGEPGCFVCDRMAMAEDYEKLDERTASEPPQLPGLAGRVARLVHWAKKSRLNMAIAAALFVSVFGSIFATWSYLAHLAVDTHDEFTLEKALKALDDKRYERAKSIIGGMQQQGNVHLNLGGALYVLGAVKSAQAEAEWSDARKRALHLVAARYLEKARELGVPKGRESSARFLTGQSLILGNQPEQGIEILNKALLDQPEQATQIHALLTEAYRTIPEPDFRAALQHSQAVLEDPGRTPEQKRAAQIIHADILGQLGRIEDARQFLQVTSDENAQKAQIKSIIGRLAILEAERLAADNPERSLLTDQARRELSEAQQLDPLDSQLTRTTMYWIGKSYELEGNRIAAINQYDNLGKSYGDSPESMAAMLNKADLAREAGDLDQALAGYRTVLASVDDPVTYVNRLLPLSSLKKRLVRAYNDLVEKLEFEQVKALVDSLQPVFDLVETTELRAKAHSKWAAVEREEARQGAQGDAEKLLAESRYQHRAAGAAYELLAKLRYSSEEFTEDLWNAAENYFLGQSYSRAKRVLQDYLHHDARRRQALALLRLGQCELALGNNDAAIETLEECIEMHPGDAVVFQARLECAEAHLQKNEGDRAEELLHANLYYSNLDTPAQEWRDSLFLLGEHLHNSERYQEAIRVLDEAVIRYPNAPQALLSRYIIARSYHSASEEPARLAMEAKTESERRNSRKLRDDNLIEALANYSQVQRDLTLKGHVNSNELERLLLRNCYMMQGSVLFQLKRYDEARKAYAKISTLYQDEPFVLESFVHIANCYRRLNKPVKAKGTIEQAKLVLNRLPQDIDFKLTTNFSRDSWDLLLNEMSQW